MLFYTETENTWIQLCKLLSQTKAPAPYLLGCSFLVLEKSLLEWRSPVIGLLSVYPLAWSHSGACCHSLYYSSSIPHSSLYCKSFLSFCFPSLLPSFLPSLVPPFLLFVLTTPSLTDCQNIHYTDSTAHPGLGGEQPYTYPRALEDRQCPQLAIVSTGQSLRAKPGWV